MPGPPTRGAGLTLSLMPRESLEALRGEVRTLEARARRKARRLKNQNNVVIAGSSVDPLRDPGNVRKYTQQQLENYRSRLLTFNSRNTQFYGDAYGRPLTASSWEAYKRAERRYNREKDRFFGQFSKLKTAHGELLAERMARVTPSHGTMVAEVNSPFADVKRTSRAFTSDKRVKLLTKYLESQVGDEAWENRIKDARRQFREMAELTGSGDMLKAVEGLNDKQFAALWFYTNFTQSMAQHYEVFKLLNGGKNSGWLTAIYQDSVKEAKREIQNAKKWRV